MINPIDPNLITVINRKHRFELMHATSFNNSKIREKIVFTIMHNEGDDFYQMLWRRNQTYIKDRLSTLNPQLKDQENT